MKLHTQNQIYICYLIFTFFLLLTTFLSLAHGEGNGEKILVKDIIQIKDPDAEYSHAGVVTTFFHVNVETHGCTDGHSFRIKVNQEDDAGKSMVHFKRIRKDECKGLFPNGKDLILSTGKIDRHSLIEFNNARVTPSEQN